MKLRNIKNEEGAIDLASIMVGIIVIGLVGGIIAATVFAVIPWAQDNAAKQQLDSVVSAQSAYKGLSSSSTSALPEGHPINSFADTELLLTAGLLAEGEGDYCTIRAERGKGYKAYSRSSSGTYWSVTDRATKPVQIAANELPDACEGLAGKAIITGTATQTTFTYKCDTATKVSLPIISGIGAAKWSDGTTSSHSGTGLITKTLTGGVEYSVTFDGTYPSLKYKDVPGAACLRSFDFWGSEVGVTDLNNAFYYATNLTDVPANLPSTVTQLSSTFQGAYKINDPDISEWDVSRVRSMASLFSRAYEFNQPLNHWNVSEVRHLDYTFYHASNFNQELHTWDTSSVEGMQGAFWNATKFNQNISNWDTSTITNGVGFASPSFPVEYMPLRTNSSPPVLAEN